MKRYLVVHLAVDNYGGKNNDVSLYQTDDRKTADKLSELLVEGTPVDGGYPDSSFVVDTERGKFTYNGKVIPDAEKELQSVLEAKAEFED